MWFQVETFVVLHSSTREKELSDSVIGLVTLVSLFAVLDLIGGLLVQCCLFSDFSLCLHASARFQRLPFPRFRFSFRPVSNSADDMLEGVETPSVFEHGAEAKEETLDWM